MKYYYLLFIFISSLLQGSAAYSDVKAQGPLCTIDEFLADIERRPIVTDENRVRSFGCMFGMAIKNDHPKILESWIRKLQTDCTEDDPINCTMYDLKRTALHHAAISNSINCILALLHHGASPNVIDATGRKPFNYNLSKKNSALLRKMGYEVKYLQATGKMTKSARRRARKTETS